ncbi:MAG: MAPEG family protein [Pseudomonadota bacterium]
MNLAITGLYAGILIIFALALSARAGSFRGKTGISIMHGEPINLELAERVRVHQNFLEYVPMALIVMALLEVNGANSTFLHVFGIVLIVARIAHAMGLKHDNMGHIGRLIGAAGTALMSAVAGLYLVWIAVSPMLGS